MKRKICSLLVIGLLLTGCGKIPKLANGNEAVVSFDNGDMISVDDLYTEIKDTYGLSSLITLIDTYVLEKTFPDYIEEAKEYAESYIKAIKANYDSDDEFLTALRTYAGVSSEEAYEEYIYLSYMQSHAAEEYAKLQITDKQINKYYENEIVGDIEVSHILITPEVTDDMTDEEKETAENNAMAEAKEILETLKSTKKADLATVFADLAKEHSDDDATASEGGSLGKINKDTLDSTYDELVDAAYSINDGEYYSKVITTELGYHIILRTKSYDKAELEDVKDSIIETLANDLLDEDSTIPTKALQYYRKELGMEIQDSELQKQYANYIQYQLTNTEE